MAPVPEPAHPSPDRLVQEFEARLRHVELVVGARIMASWAEASELTLEEARLLLVLETGDGASSAGELAQVSGISIEAVYPALHRLVDRGDIREDHRRYSVTEAGERSLASLEAARRAGIQAYLSDLSAGERRELESALGLRSPG
jgi:DNA-binding MarR family transcriptional regulator